MKFRNLILIVTFILISGCVGYSSTGVLGTGVSVAMDPRTIGTQIDDSIMQKNLRAKLILMDSAYLLKVKTKVLDGRIFITGKVDTVEEKLKITKLGWEIKGARSVRNDLKIKENFNLSPRGIREMLNLNKPIYEKTAAYGHFGRAPEENGSFSWEKTDKTNVFSK